MYFKVSVALSRSMQVIDVSTTITVQLAIDWMTKFTRLNILFGLVPFEGVPISI